MTQRLRTAPAVRAFFLAAVFAMAGCASGPEPIAQSNSLFYPEPPAPARLQFLARFSSPLDLGKKEDAFRDFLFGDEGNHSHIVQKPYGLALYDGAIYVVDTRGPGYVVFDLARDDVRVVRASGAGKLRKPINISIDDDGTRYVTDTEREQIVVFDRNDRYLRAFGEAGDYKPVDVTIVDDKLYVTDILHHRIVVIDKSSGTILDQFGTVGSDPGELFQPTNLSLGPDDLLYVTDTGNFQVDVFSLDGQFIREIGEIGTMAGQFARPKGIALDRENRLYVVDAAFENVQILHQNGTSLLYFSGPGEGPGAINLPTAVKVDYDNVAYFQKYVDPSFKLEYVVLVASQFGVNKVTVFGFGEIGKRAGTSARPPANDGDGEE